MKCEIDFVLDDSPHHGLAPSIVVEGKDIMVNQDIAIEIKQIPIQDGRVPKH